MDSESRLDAVKWLRSRQEQKERQAWASARQLEAQARERAEALQQELHRPRPPHADAAMWALSDLSSAEGFRRLELARVEVSRAAELAQHRQTEHRSAHQRLKAVERVIDTLLEEERADELRRERRDADELTILRYAR